MLIFLLSKNILGDHVEEAQQVGGMLYFQLIHVEEVDFGTEVELDFVHLTSTRMKHQLLCFLLVLGCIEVVGKLDIDAVDVFDLSFALNIYKAVNSRSRTPEQD